MNAINLKSKIFFIFVILILIGGFIYVYYQRPKADIDTTLARTVNGRIEIVYPADAVLKNAYVMVNLYTPNKSSSLPDGPTFIEKISLDKYKKISSYKGYVAVARIIPITISPGYIFSIDIVDTAGKVLNDYHTAKNDLPADIVKNPRPPYLDWLDGVNRFAGFQVTVNNNTGPGSPYVKLTPYDPTFKNKKSNSNIMFANFNIEPNPAQPK